MKEIQMMIRKFLLVFGFIFLVGFTFNERLESEPIENLAVQSATGYDVKKTVDSEFEYSIPVSVYIFNMDSNISSKVYTGKGTTISITRESRQRKLNRRFIVGFEKVYIIGESVARYGIKPVIDILMKNPWVNDNGYALVCKVSAEDLMKLKIEGYPTSADYLEGMIYSCKSHDFFTKEYSLISLIQTVDAEGKKAALPYIEVKNGKPDITGMAIFNKDKMVMTLDIKDTRIMNMMRNNNVNGIVDLEKNSKEYAAFDANVKRKVKCYKEGDKFKFVINLTLNGNVINNQLYLDMPKKPELQKEFEEDITRQITASCEDFIDKMKNEYKMDIINLSEVAVAKYGRGTGIDWDKAVSEADIEVKVKVKVNQQLRGDY